jgi:DNA mismatch repair protein MutL
MPAIHRLPPHLVNKIAAGEVIERPASVVKELVENAIDAGASRIEVTIEDGGKKRISVRDDGSGMDADDLEMAFTAHATSKISSDEDLFRIDTMGFRGEALASIASISHAHIRTRPRQDDQAEGFEIRASGQTIEPVRPCASAEGTTITIRDLFFNTPARRKFLRTTATELGHVTEQMTRLALPHPQIAFRLEHNGRENMNLPATTSTARRAGDLFGPELGEALLPLVSRQSGSVSVQGLIAPPVAARGSGKWQYFFLNGRYVRDRLLTHALREAYRGLIDPSKYPVALVFIEIDPSKVDINVHPSKIEVRFRDTQAVHGSLLGSLKETLNRARLTPDARLQRAENDGARQPGTDDRGDDETRRQSLREALADFFKSQPAPPQRLNYHSDQQQEPGLANRPPLRPRTAQPQGRVQRFEPGLPLVGHRSSSPAVERDRQSKVPASTPTPAAPGAVAKPGAPQPAARQGILQIHETYLVAPCDDGLLIVDQHALHERILYNQFSRRLAEGPLTGQRLLIPETVTVTASETALLEAHAELLDRLGMEVESFGPESAAIQQFPAALLDRKVDPKAFLRELLDILAEDETAGPERVLEDVLAMMACKAAIKANHPLTQDEMADLLAQGAEAAKSSACPHGRPTTLKLTLAELEKQFHRT